MSLIVGLFLCATTGLSLGLLGGGGSIITVPVLVYMLNVDAHQAVGMSLAVVSATSFIGTILHSRYGNVQPRVGLLLGASGVLSAYFGSHLSYLVSHEVLLLSFAALMLFIAVLMLTMKQSGRERAHGLQQQPYKAILTGAVVGGLTGFLGVGGGFLIVPALTLFGGLAMKEAVGTSLLVITMNCAAGVLGHWQTGGLDLHLTMLVTLLAVSGVLLGVTLSRKTPPARLQVGFAMFVMVVAFFLIAKNYSAVL